MQGGAFSWLSGDHTWSMPERLAARGIRAKTIHECWGAAWQGTTSESWVSADSSSRHAAHADNAPVSVRVSAPVREHRAEQHFVFGHFLTDAGLVAASITLVEQANGRFLTTDGHEARATWSTSCAEMVIVELCGSCPRTFIATAPAIERVGLGISASRILLN